MSHHKSALPPCLENPNILSVTLPGYITFILPHRNESKITFFSLLNTTWRIVIGD